MYHSFQTYFRKECKDHQRINKKDCGRDACTGAYEYAGIFRAGTQLRADAPGEEVVEAFVGRAQVLAQVNAAFSGKGAHDDPGGPGAEQPPARFGYPGGGEDFQHHSPGGMVIQGGENPLLSALRARLFHRFHRSAHPQSGWNGLRGWEGGIS